jgi:dephospho-CoA kinase
MLIAGLTGSIGMGKSTVARHIRSLGFPVFDADAEVHRLYAGPAVDLVESAFPGVTVAGAIDRSLLAAALARDPSGFKRLEAIVHPLVHDGQREFLRRSHREGVKVAFLEIPLLLEGGGHTRVDRIVVVSAGKEAQTNRVLERTGMTLERLEQIRSRQLPDAEKRRRAHFVVDTSTNLSATYLEVDRILDALAGLKGEAFDLHWR